ncbi:hypothetical protein LWI29_035681 [Acer saccharum]|uniref:Plant PDR ABC transporter associated domain-containing protein n=1 Tax=Acer saccharum TaxID=4024 RepID=A0AA39SST0_ACESA|nr:hypothetical protein LWI29_035681 [Acer saccharum]
MGPSDFTSIIWFQCSEKEWIGVAALLGFTVLFNVLLYLNREMEIMKVSCQSNAVGGTSNKVEDEIAVNNIFHILSLSLYSVSVFTLFQEASSLNNPNTTVAASPSAISTTQNPMDNFDSIYSTYNSYNTTLFNEETQIHNEDTTTTTQHNIPLEVVDTTYTAVVAAGNTYISETIEKGDIPPLGSTSDDHYYCNSYNNTNNKQSSTPCE